jgi:hypothetical protein
MQTLLVHMRRPHRLIIGGNALVALVHPLLVLRMILRSLQPGPGENGLVLKLAFCVLVVVAGYLLSASIGFLGSRNVAC